VLVLSNDWINRTSGNVKGSSFVYKIKNKTITDRKGKTKVAPRLKTLSTKGSLSVFSADFHGKVRRINDRQQSKIKATHWQNKRG